MGRKAHKPTQEMRDKVTMYAKSLKQQDIADLLNISIDTLQKYYSEEFNLGKIKTKAFVVNKLFENINKGNQKAIEYYLDKIGFGEDSKQDESVKEAERIADNRLLNIFNLIQVDTAEKDAPNDDVEDDEDLF